MVTAAVRPRGEAGEAAGVPLPPAGDGRAVRHKIGEPAERPIPSSSSQPQPKVPEAAKLQTPCEPRFEGSDDEFSHGAAEDCGASEAFQQKYGLWLAMTVSAYAPFLDEETGELDWMEESSY